eukprot:1413066-Amphidinium_carterae.1
MLSAHLSADGTRPSAQFSQCSVPATSRKLYFRIVFASCPAQPVSTMNLHVLCGHAPFCDLDLLERLSNSLVPQHQHHVARLCTGSTDKTSRVFDIDAGEDRMMHASILIQWRH